MTLRTRTTTRAWWAVPVTATLLITGCSGDGDADGSPVSTQPEATTQAAPDSSPTDADIDVDSSGDPTADAQAAGARADLGTAVATLSVPLPGEWQYEGTYGDGGRPYAVLVDASRPFDLSQPGSDAYEESVWVQVETYQLGGESPYGGEMPEDADTLAEQISSRTGGDAATASVGDVAVVHGDSTESGAEVRVLWVRSGDIWIMARPSNVDVDAYLDGDADDGILTAVLERSEVK